MLIFSLILISSTRYINTRKGMLCTALQLNWMVWVKKFQTLLNWIQRQLVARQIIRYILHCRAKTNIRLSFLRSTAKTGRSLLLQPNYSMTNLNCKKEQYLRWRWMTETIILENLPLITRAILYFQSFIVHQMKAFQGLL